MMVIYNKGVQEIKAVLMITGKERFDEIERILLDLFWKDLSIKLEEDEDFGEHEAEEGEARWTVDLHGFADCSEANLENFINARFSGSCVVWEFESSKPRGPMKTLAIRASGSSGGENQSKNLQNKKASKKVSQLLSGHIPHWMKTFLNKDEKDLKLILDGNGTVLEKAAAAHQLVLIREQTKQFKDHQKEKQKCVDRLQKNTQDLDNPARTMSYLFSSPTHLYREFLNPKEYDIDRYTNLLNKVSVLVDATRFEEVQNIDRLKDHETMLQLRKCKMALNSDLSRLVSMRSNRFHDPLGREKYHQMVEKRCLKELEEVCGRIEALLEDLKDELKGLDNQYFEECSQLIPDSQMQRMQISSLINNKNEITDFYVHLKKLQTKQLKDRIAQLEAVESRAARLAARDLKMQDQNLDVIQKRSEQNPRKRHGVFVEGDFEDGLVYISKSSKPRKEAKTSYGMKFCWTDEINNRDPEEKISRIIKNLESLHHVQRKALHKAYEGWPVYEDGYIKNYLENNIDMPAHAFNAPDSSVYKQHLIATVKPALSVEVDEQILDKILEDYASVVWEVYQLDAKIYRSTSIKESQGFQNHLEAKVSADREFDVVNKLLSHGAQLDHHNIELPEYNSWADVQGGYAYNLEIDGVKISYVPYHAEGVLPVDVLRWKLNTKKHHDIIQQRLLDAMENQQIKPQNAFVARNSGEKHFSVDLDAYYLMSRFDVVSMDESEFIKKAVPGATVHYLDSYNNHRSIEIDSLENYLKDESRKDLKKMGSLRKLPNGNWARAHSNIIKVLKSLEQQDEILFDDPHYQIALGEGYDHTRRRWQDLNIPDLLKDDMNGKNNVFEDLVEKEYIKQDEFFYQTAPDSEQGRFFVEGGDALGAVDLLKKLDIVKQVEPSVPLGIIEGNSSCYYNHHPDYTKHTDVPKLPEDYGIIHGMTGSSDVQDGHSQAVNNLEKIIRSGGLFSIKTRRHMGAVVSSLSPLGDIASGIDHGVPATLGRKPVYGDNIFFLIKPDALAREKIWLAPTDFGGGSNRSQKYDDYATSLGERNHFQAPSKESRDKHLKSLEDGSLFHDNEIYFENGIPLGDIDTVFVNEDVFEETTQMLHRMREEGLLENDVRIVEFEGETESLKNAISKRTWQLNGGDAYSEPNEAAI